MLAMQTTRYFLFILTFLLVACGTDESATVDTETVVEPSAVQVIISADDFAVGEQRLPIVLFDGPDVMTDAQAIQLTVLDIDADPFEPVWQGDATYYGDFEQPYWVVYPDFPRATQWGLVLDVTLADGTAERVQRRLDVVEKSRGPNVGDAAIAVDSLTTADTDVSRLSSAENPDPALYSLSLSDALTNGKPTVLSFATPAFCATAVCAPVVDMMADVTQPFADQLNRLHIDVFDMGQHADSGGADLVVSQPVVEWNLGSEPWTYVIDGDGTIVARFGGPLAGAELDAALREVLP